MANCGHHNKKEGMGIRKQRIPHAFLPRFYHNDFYPMVNANDRFFIRPDDRFFAKLVQVYFFQSKS